MSQEKWDFDGAGRPIEASETPTPVKVDGWKCLCQLGRRRGRPSWQAYGSPCRYCGRVVKSPGGGDFIDEGGNTVCLPKK